MNGDLWQLFRLGFGGVVGGKAPTANLKNPRRRSPARVCPANNRGQVNQVVGEVELHFVKREVREGDFLRVDRVPIAVGGCGSCG